MEHSIALVEFTLTWLLLLWRVKVTPQSNITEPWGSIFTWMLLFWELNFYTVLYTRAGRRGVALSPSWRSCTCCLGMRVSYRRCMTQGNILSWERGLNTHRKSFYRHWQHVVGSVTSRMTSAIVGADSDVTYWRTHTDTHPSHACLQCGILRNVGYVIAWP